MSGFGSASATKRIPAPTTPTMIGALILFLAALVIVIIYAELVGRNAYNNRERAQYILLTEREVNIAMLDMETSMRGYIIVGKDEFLAPYNEASKRLPEYWNILSSEVVRIENLDSSVRSQLELQVTQIKVTADTWKREWGDSQIKIRQEGRTEEAISNLSSATGQGLFDGFRQASSNLNDTLTRQLGIFSDSLNNIRWIELVIILVLALSTLAGAIITMRTARRELRLEMEATRRIENEHRQLIAVVNNLPVAVRVAEAPDSQVILQNHQAEEIFPAGVWNSMTRAERIKYFDLRTADGELVDANNPPIANHLAAGETASDVELLTSRPESGTKHLMVSAAPIKDKDGMVTSSVLVMRDITQLKAIDHRKDEFIAIAAHELRNPLAALVGYNHLAKRTLAKVNAGATTTEQALPAIERHLGEMGKQIERLTKLIARLLDASRVQLGKLILEKSPTDLVKMAEEAVANAQTTDAGQHEIELTTPTQLIGQWDPTRIEQVITNLLDNALRYSPVGSAVSVSISEEDNMARVEVTDHGPGISDYQRTHLFNRYYGPIPPEPTPEGAQGPKTKRGLGLGLYVSAEIVIAHRGEIGVRPNPKGGSVFWFILPLEEVEQPKE